MLTFLVFAGSIMVLVGLHEAGHFLVARAFGVYIKEFAIGFGPKIFAIQGKETRYSLRLIPFGGYVKMAGEDRLEDDESIPHDRVLYSKPPYARALISLAGPLANLLLAFSITMIVAWTISFPVLQVAEIVPESPAAEVLQFGDRILEMDGHRILTRDQVTSAVEASEGHPIAIQLERDGVQLEILIEPEYIAEESRFVVGAYFFPSAPTNEVSAVDAASLLADLGLRERDRIIAVSGEPTLTFFAVQLAVEAELSPSEVTLTAVRDGDTLFVVIPNDEVAAFRRFAGVQFSEQGNELLSVESTSIMATHGLQIGDYITAVNNEPTDSLAAIQIATDAALPAEIIELTLLRGAETVVIVIPTVETTVYDLFAGAEFADLGVAFRHANLGEGIVLASAQFVGYIRALAEVIRGIFAGQVTAGEVFQGPVGVAKILGEGIRISGTYFFQLLAFLSLNFGLINLVPFPALDGSRVVFSLYEWIRGKPIPPQREGVIHAIGFLILIALMILITYRDIARLFQ